MTPEYYAYRTFLAVRNHFTKEFYNYFFYNGHTKTSENKFKDNKNYEQFISLSRRASTKDLPYFIASNLAYTRGAIWVTDLLTIDAKNRYSNFRKYIEASSYFFAEDMKKLGNLNLALKITNDQYPKIIIDSLSGKIRMESLCILDYLYSGKMTEYFAANIHEPYLWPTFKLRYTKYTPFLTFDSAKCKKELDNLLETK